MTNLSNRVLNMEESVTLAASARAKALKAEGRDILPLTLGEPDFITPKNIQDVTIEAIQNGKASFYTVASGLPELKDAINSHMEKSHGYSINRNQVVVAAGAKFILHTFFTTVLNPGDEVVIPTPCWVSYVDQVKMVDGVPVAVTTTESDHFKATVEQLETARTEKTKVLLLNSPFNPTDTTYIRDELGAIENWAVEHNILILADDIYGRLVYDGNESTPVSSISEAIRKQTVVVNGVSKTYTMTGWRVGFAVAEEEIISGMAEVISQTTSNLTAVSQHAAIKALTGPQDPIETIHQAFEGRLNTIYPLLNEAPGFGVIKPQGAFYLFPNVKKAMGMRGYTDVTAFTTAILEEIGVAFVIGAGFGAPENARLSYATDLDTSKDTVNRLKAFMEK